MFPTFVLGSGYLGEKLYESYQNFPDLEQSFMTSYKPSASTYFFDLSNPSLDELPLPAGKFSYAFIGAGISSPGRCEKEKEYTYLCNVTNTVKVAIELHKRGICPILCSTDYVFSGLAGDYSEESSTDPICEYGKQKAELEKLLAENLPGSYILLRLSKVFGHKKGDKTLLDEMAFRLSLGETIHVAEDQLFCPISIEDVIFSIHKLQASGFRGLINLCGSEKWSRLDLAFSVAEKLGASRKLIIPIKLKDLKESFSRPTNTSMRNDKLIDLTGVRIKNIDFSIMQIAKNYFT